MTDDAEAVVDEQEPGKYRRLRPEGPEGWIWKETGARGPTWYPPIAEGEVDRGGEHLALHRVDSGRVPDGDALAYAAAADDDALFFQIVDRCGETAESVERLNDSCFDEMGSGPTFDLAYEFCGKTANKSYLNPMWVYLEG